MRTKILLFIFIMLFFGTNHSFAQKMAAYEFTYSIKTYQEITDGNVLGKQMNPIPTGLSFNKDTVGVLANVISRDVGFPIGFDFTFGSLSFNRFAISTYGYIVLGRDSVSIQGSAKVFADTIGTVDAGKAYIIGNIPNTNGNSCMAGRTHLNNTGRTEVNYTSMGTTPNRILVVQFKNFKNNRSGGDVDTINFQIRLYETSDKIEIIYGTFLTDISSMPPKVFVGLKGSGPQDVHQRATTSPTSWATTVQTTNGTCIWSKSIYPAWGSCFTFTPPPPCEPPSAQPSSLSLVNNSDNLEVSFRPATKVDKYIGFLSLNPDYIPTLTDGTEYTEKEIADKGALAFMGSDTAYILHNLLSDTTYYVWVYSMNDLCKGGPLYYLESPLRGKARTRVSKPDTCEVKEITSAAFHISVTPNKNNSKIIVVYSVQKQKGPDGFYINQGVFGIPEGELSVNDTLKGGGWVVYKGEASDDIFLKNPQNSTIHFVRVYGWEPKSQTYSSNYSEITTSSIIELPYSNSFEEEPRYQIPYAWTKLCPSNVSSVRYDGSALSLGVANNANRVDLITPWIQLTDTLHRFIGDIKMDGSRGNPYYLTANDTLQIQLSEDGNTFVPVYTFKGSDFNGTNWLHDFSFQFDQFKGKKVKLRIYVVTKAATYTFKLDNLLIEAVPACEYPSTISVIEEKLTPSSAALRWTSGNDASLWNLSWRLLGEKEWRQEVQANSNPFVLDGLPSASPLEVRVQSLCSQENISPWSRSKATLTTLYSVPFLSDLNTLTTASFPPKYWNLKEAYLNDTGNVIFTSAGSAKWTLQYWEMEIRNKAAEINFQNAANAKTWLMMPIVDIGNGNLHYQLEFDARIVNPNDISKSVDSVPENIRFACVISTDSGKTFSHLNTLRLWNSKGLHKLTDFDYKGSHISIDLSPYTGPIQIGLYAEQLNGTYPVSLRVDNFAVQPTCASPRKLSIQDIQSTSVHITWEDEGNFLFTYKNAQTTFPLQSIDTDFLNLYGLEPQTTYTYTLQKVCRIGDTSAPIEGRFSTASAEPCREITQHNVREITPVSARISWTSKSSKTHLKFRRQGASAWISYTMEEDTLKELLALVPGTTYEYTLQAKCSDAFHDTSTWTSIRTFTTPEISCIAPVNLGSNVLSYSSALLYWKGTSNHYELGYRKTGESSWILLFCSDTSVMMENLAYSTTYEFRVRSICEIADTSAYSSRSEFTTLAPPPCLPPDNTSVIDIKPNSVTLCWEAGNLQNAWTLLYRLNAVQNYDSITYISQSSQTLMNLQANSTYTWRIRSHCEGNRQSPLSQANVFTTSATSIEAESSFQWQVFADKGLISIHNPNSLKIESVEVYTLMGKKLCNHRIQTHESVFVSIPPTKGILLVRILSEGEIYVYKVSID